MADVTEVIHRITYEVNNDAIINAQKVFSAQLVELDKLNRELIRLQNNLSNISEKELALLDKVASRIENISRLLQMEIGKTQGLLSQATSGVLAGLKIPTDVTELFKKLTEGLAGLDMTGKKASVTVTGFAKAAKAASSGPLSSLLSSVSLISGRMLSFGNIIGIALTALSFFSSKVEDTREETNDLGDALDTAAENSRKLGEEAGNELATLLLLKNRVEDVTESTISRKKAIKDLRKLYPSYFNDLTDEEIKSGKVADAYERIVKSILAAAMARVLSKNLEETLGKLVEIQDKIQALTKNEGIELKIKVNKDGLKEFSLPEAVEADIKADIAKGLTPIAADQTARQLPVNAPRQEKKEKQVILPSDELTISLLHASSLSSSVDRLVNAIASLEIEPTTGTGTSQPAPKTTGAVEIRQRKEEEPLERAPFSWQKEREAPVFEEKDVPDVDIDKIQEQEKASSEAQAAHIKKQIEGYQQLAQAAADAYNQILQVQVDALDKEISIREKRVEQAKKLAERGNTEALRIEEDRLRKAQQQREKFARQQQVVNAAITVSNAIAAVARAALEGGGFGSVATIAALIAALGAGYAAVSSLSSGGESFADGVIDYKGKGGPRDDKNWVRISSGESVITAEATHKNRQLLEAINNGAALHMIDPSLPLMIPNIKQPTITGGATFATVKDMGKLEEKLDEVVYAIESNKMKQNIFFDEQGVGIMTQKAVQRERRRWK